MVDKIQRAHSSNNVMNNEEFINALTDVQNTIIRNLLNATTPEDREKYYHEHEGIKRAMNVLAKWAGPVRHNNKDSK